MSSMASDLDDEMRKQLSCSVCLDLYTDPWLLPCLHSLCRRCIQELETVGIKDCPECKEKISPGNKRTKLKRNFPLNNLVEIYKQSKEASVRRTHPQQVQTSRIYPNIAFTQGTGRQAIAPEPQTTQVQETTQVQQTIHLMQTVTEPSRPVLQKQCSTCDPGSTTSAEVYCQTCTMSFCPGCLDALHPKDTDHSLVSVTDVDKIELCVLCGSPATVRCIECQMTFCPQCLGSYHPTTTSSPGHTLVDVKAKASRENLIPRQQSQSGPAAPPASTESSTTGKAPANTGSIGKRGFSSLEIARDVSEATKERECRLCQLKGMTQEGSHRCLDCSMSICNNCLFHHRQDAPSHTVINIAIAKQPGQQQQPQQQQQSPLQPKPQLQLKPQLHPKPQSQLRPTTHNNDIQQKLLELMEIKTDVLTELLEALRYRDVSDV